MREEERKDRERHKFIRDPCCFRINHLRNPRDGERDSLNGIDGIGWHLERHHIQRNP